MTIEIAPRHSWVAALAAVDEHDLLALSEELVRGWQIRHRSIPQSGLGLLRLRDSALLEDFYLGEFPVSMAWLEVISPAGELAEGAAQVMNDRQELAEAMAICDAILSSRLPGWEQVAWLINKGLALQHATQRERKLMLAHTRVDFSLLDEAED